MSEERFVQGSVISIAAWRTNSTILAELKIME
jgi:hypothetical protein